MTSSHSRASAICGLVMPLLLAGFACGQPPAHNASRTGADSALVREQGRRLAAYDSVVRSINTDSAYKLWHVMLTASDIRTAQLDMLCEYLRLSKRYGRNAAHDALARMRDTLWKHDDGRRVRDMDKRLAGESPMIGRNTCGPQSDPPAPNWLAHWYVPALPALPPSPDGNGAQ